MIILCGFFAISLQSLAQAADPAMSPLPIIQSIEFKAKVKPSVFSIQGKLDSAPQVDREGDQTVVSLSPDKLKTGLSLRDRHMIEKIFTDPTGKVPPVQFKFQKLGSMGTLSFRGRSRPFGFECNTPLTCSGTVKLSEFEVTGLSHLGVTVEDGVDVKVELKP